ncbi:MAG: class I SAM-dependent methyltransferase [Deltaproteobacteria bacterium]|nr:MAG: class I SAM-dependent methyltransferase [Deltaproteobacteria bacterium]
MKEQLNIMIKKQQDEALKYFEEHAEKWRKLAKSSAYDKVNVIKQRNDFVLKVVADRKITDTALDVGCGTGDLVCEMASRGIKALGVDFAREMIDLAEENARNSNLLNAKFFCCSIFDFPFEPEKYDLISANGFIEYISYAELDRLFKSSYESLKKEGSLVLGSRNRLFNIFSLNKFTQDEIVSNEIIALLLEAIQIMKSEHIADLIGFETAPLQKEDKEHEITGIKVSTRYQFTPAQLASMLHAKGFEPIEIYPIHIHGSFPKFKEKNPAVHVLIANFLQEFAKNNACLIPQSSSFMIHGKKR